MAWNQAPFSGLSIVRLCSCPESSRHVSAHAFLGTAQSCKISEFQSYHICCFRWFFRPVEKQIKNTIWSFVCNSELLLMCRRLTASAFPGSWKLASLRCLCNIQSPGNCWVFTRIIWWQWQKNHSAIFCYWTFSVTPNPLWHFANASFWSARNPGDILRPKPQLNCRISGLVKCRGFSYTLCDTNRRQRSVELF